MRLDFNVLWVDDQPTWIDSLRRAIGNQMAVEGFEFKPTVCASMDNVRTCIASDLFSDEVDLILVDWDLGHGIEGQDAIAEIRNTIQYKNIVFYSAQTTPDSLRQKALEAGLEGFYCVTREGLVDEVIAVFESLVKRVLDLDHARGIVMGATSDIDSMVTECLQIMHQRLDINGKNAMLAYAMKGIKGEVKKLEKKATRLQEAATMDEFLDDISMFTAMDRLKFLSRALKTTFKKFDASRPAVTTYMKDVVPKRNVLGHRILIPEGKPQQVITKDRETLSLLAIRELRCQILDMRNEFRKLLEALREAGD